MDVRRARRRRKTALQSSGNSTDTLLAAPPPERFLIVEPGRAHDAFASIDGSGYAYVSPLVQQEMHGRVPSGIRQVPATWRVPAAAIVRLRVDLALEVALRTHMG